MSANYVVNGKGAVKGVPADIYTAPTIQTIIRKLLSQGVSIDFFIKALDESISEIIKS